VSVEMLSGSGTTPDLDWMRIPERPWNGIAGCALLSADGHKGNMQSGNTVADCACTATVLSIECSFEHWLAVLCSC